MVIVGLIVAVGIIVVLGAAWESWRATRRALDAREAPHATLRMRCRPDDRVAGGALAELAQDLDLSVASPVWADRWHVTDGTDQQIDQLADRLIEAAEAQGFVAGPRRGPRTVLRRRLMWLTIGQTTR